VGIIENIKLRINGGLTEQSYYFELIIFKKIQGFLRDT